MSQQIYHVFDGSEYVGQYIATPAQMQAVLTANNWTTGNAPTAAQLLERQRGVMVVSRFQAKQAMDNAGILATVEAAVTTAGGQTLRAWNEALEFRRNSPTINNLKTAVNLTDAQIDALFIAAAEIEA